MTLDPLSAIPPTAPQKPHRVCHHGDVYDDAYFWLRDPGYPDVKDEDILAHLRAENSYTEAVLASEQNTIDQLFDEIKSRLPDADEAVPWHINGVDYCWRFAAGAQYRSWWRKPTGADAWSLMLDETIEAKGKQFFALKALVVSPDGKTLAYAVDTTGGERFDIMLRHLDGAVPDQMIASNQATSLAFDAKGDHVITVEVSEEWRPFRVQATQIKTGDTRTLYEESDPGFFVGAAASSDRQYLILSAGDHETRQCFTLPLADIAASLEPFSDRQEGHDYELDHDDQGFLIRSNRMHKNFGLYRVKNPAQQDPAWDPILEGSDTRYVTDFATFKAGIAIAYRKDGLDQISLVRPDGSQADAAFPDQAYEAELDHNPDYNAGFVRLAYSALTTPTTLYDMAFDDAILVVRKQQVIPDGYDTNQLVSKRILVTARDGAQVPVSLVHRKDWQKGGLLHLYGYGAYGLGMMPSFSAARLSLLDRGFAYAIAHIRGGDEKGRLWYEDGKRAARTNTFHDFVDVSRHLIDSGYTGHKKITISGGSAGGELMGAVLNEAKEIYAASVLHVPFVDVLNTMLDGSLPLTPMEWPEWGNPIDDEDAYHLIKSYCPYQNMAPGDWPPVFITAGLADPRVTYWEPAKYAAKLRALTKGQSLVMLKTNMEAGHGGKSGRFDRYREVAEEYAFLLAVTNP